MRACGRWLQGLCLLKIFSLIVAHRKGPQAEAVPNQTWQEVHSNWNVNDSCGSVGFQWEIIHLETGKKSHPVTRKVPFTLFLSILLFNCRTHHTAHTSSEIIQQNKLHWLDLCFLMRETWKFSASPAVSFSGLQGIHLVLESIHIAQLSIKSYLLFLLNITYIGYSEYYWKIIILSVNLRTEIYHRVYLNKKSYNRVISKMELSSFSFRNIDLCQNKTIAMKPRQWEF